jgi:mannose/fructose-specific phosphotransferase system component IIA
MTRSEAPVHGIIVGHGDLPRALLDAAGSITGDTSGVTVISNRDYSAAELVRRMIQAIDDCGSDNVVVFVDMFGSSCSTAGARVRRDRSGVAVMCGVNLPMLIRFLSYRQRAAFDELVRLVQEAGQTAVKPVEPSN